MLAGRPGLICDKEVAMSDELFGRVVRAAVAVMAWSAALASVGTAFYIVCATVDGGLNFF